MQWNVYDFLHLTLLMGSCDIKNVYLSCYFKVCNMTSHGHLEVFGTELQDMYLNHTTPIETDKDTTKIVSVDVTILGVWLLYVLFWQ